MARVQLSMDRLNSDFVRRVAELSGQNLLACYQCGKCSAGCPAAHSMNVLPSQIIRLVQLGLEDEVLQSETIWYCASCLTCVARCPKGVDLAKVMEAIRKIALDRYGDHINVAKISPEELAEWPQQAFIGGFRKYIS